MTSLREYAGYHGGGSGFGGQLRSWNPPSESVDAALLPNFTRGNARADDLVRNNGYAANAIQVGGQAVLGRQNILPTPWLTERHGYDPTWQRIWRAVAVVEPTE